MGHVRALATKQRVQFPRPTGSPVRDGFGSIVPDQLGQHRNGQQHGQMIAGAAGLATIQHLGKTAAPAPPHQ